MTVSTDCPVPFSPHLVPPARRGARNLIAAAGMVVLWLFLWTWLAVGVAAPLGGLQRELGRRAAVEERA